jgi:hypothetical protein
MIFGVDSTHNKLRDQLTSAHSPHIGCNKTHIMLTIYMKNLEILSRGTCLRTVIPAN